MSPRALRGRTATSPSEVLDAWTLVHRVYVEHGHIAPQPGELYLAPGALHPRTVVWNGYEHGRLAATLTTIADSELGLPPDDGFPDELRALRAEGGALVFCGQFVSAPLGPEDSPATAADRAALSMELFAMVAQRARDDDRGLRLLANPVRRHVRFYERFLGFEQRGPIRTYGRYRVESALMVTDLEKLRAAPRLPAEIREALARPSDPAPFPVGVTSATLSDPRMRAYVEALWGADAPVWAYAPCGG
ncbi:MAG TPA: hypothetical protein VM513_06785 [Kofleriaceae bacterium]|nr:hypothetical protein [Kofleriaceae bacterium]